MFETPKQQKNVTPFNYTGDSQLFCILCFLGDGHGKSIVYQNRDFSVSNANLHLRTYHKASLQKYTDQLKAKEAILEAKEKLTSTPAKRGCHQMKMNELVQVPDIVTSTEITSPIPCMSSSSPSSKPRK